MRPHFCVIILTLTVYYSFWLRQRRIKKQKFTLYNLPKICYNTYRKVSSSC